MQTGAKDGSTFPAACVWSPAPWRVSLPRSPKGRRGRCAGCARIVTVQRPTSRTIDGRDGRVLPVVCVIPDGGNSAGPARGELTLAR
jgi:hypothetical protein